MPAKTKEEGAWSAEKRLQMARIFFDIFRGRSPAEISALTERAGLKRSESTVRRDRDECMRLDSPSAPNQDSCRAYMAVLHRPAGIDLNAPGAYRELFDLAEAVSREYQGQFGIQIYTDEEYEELPGYWSKLIARMAEKQWLSVIDIIEINLEQWKVDPATEQVRHYLFYYLGIAYNYLGKNAESLRRFEQALAAAQAHPKAQSLIMDVLLMCGLKAADCGQIDKAEGYLRQALAVLDSRSSSILNVLVLASKLQDKVFGWVVGTVAKTIQSTNQELDWGAIRQLILGDSELSSRKEDGIFLEVIKALDRRIDKGFE